MKFRSVLHSLGWAFQFYWSRQSSEVSASLTSKVFWAGTNQILVRSTLSFLQSPFSALASGADNKAASKDPSSCWYDHVLLPPCKDEAGRHYGEFTAVAGCVWSGACSLTQLLLYSNVTRAILHCLWSWLLQFLQSLKGWHFIWKDWWS